MKINSTVLTIIAISLVVIASYYIGASNQKVNPDRQSTHTSIVKTEHSATSRNDAVKVVIQEQSTASAVSKQTEAIDAESKQNYQSKMDNQRVLVLTGADLPKRHPALNVPVKTAPRKTKPSDVYDDLELRSQTYEAIAYHTLQLRLANAGFVYDKKTGKLSQPETADLTLADIAYNLYKIDMIKIQGHRDLMKQKFRLVDNDDTLDYDQKRMVKQMLLEREEEPVYMPK